MAKNIQETTTYTDAIEQVMLHNGYFAPLKVIYREIWKYKDKSTIVGKTPDFTIQAIVQRDPKYTRIGLGVYALTEFLYKLRTEPAPKTAKAKQDSLHSRIQGMLIEIGNSKAEVAETYTNDKKKIFENKTLGSLSTIKDIPPFTYQKIIQESVRFADVIWFNSRKFPHKIFEVEHSTDFRDALVKFSELQDFRSSFCCISSADRKSKFDRELSKVAFQSIQDRCDFFTYEQVENDYSIALRKTNL